AALTIAVVASAIYLSYLGATGDVDMARTALTTVTVACGVVLIPFVEPPNSAWVGGDVLSGDWRPTALALGMFGVYAVVLAVPPLRFFFELSLLRPLDYVVIAIVVAVWALLLRFIWRTWRFELALDSKEAS
nr:haloacid dehalogenase [Anaerolineae bacterium]NIN96169.1 haloacid dehalogenase [Anaerolineae bacterium]NIQ78001.1 haloacid dehalogenase [Anaerolineae bacterium]